MKRSLLLFALFASASLAGAAPSGVYTNHAGLAVAGQPAGLTNDCVLFRIDGQAAVERIPLSIFPEGERRRLCADAGSPLVPAGVRRAVEGVRDSVRRSRDRAARKLCTEAESAAHCAKAVRALDLYLDKAVARGEVTREEAAFLRFPSAEPRTMKP